MSPRRYRKCLAILGVSQLDLATILSCSAVLTHAWATGRSVIPLGLGEWLEEWVAIGQAPPLPNDWHV